MDAENIKVEKKLVFFLKEKSDFETKIDN